MNVKALEKKYDMIYGRDALIISSTELRFYFFSFLVKASLGLSATR